MMTKTRYPLPPDFFSARCKMGFRFLRMAALGDLALKESSPSSSGTIRERTPYLSRFDIGPRLTACFLLIISLLLLGDGLLAWQLSQLRTQANRLAATDQELIAVLRFQTSLHNFYNRLNDLVQTENKEAVFLQTEDLRKSLDDDANRTQELISRASGDAKLGALVSPTIESVQSALPFQLEAIRELAAAGDWVAIRERVVRQVHPLEILSSDLVKSVDEEVANERADAASSIRQAQSRMLLIFLLSGCSTLVIAAVLGAGITRSVTGPLNELMQGSRALARGDFEHRVTIQGNDELAQLGAVANETARTLNSLYENLRSSEEQLRESEKELRKLIELVPAHVFVLRPDGTGLFANPVVLDYYGTTLERWAAEGFRNTVVHREDLDRYLSGLDIGFKGREPFELEARILGKDGRYRWFLSRFNPLQDERGNILRWYVARTDIEESKQEAQRAVNENLALREEVNRTSMFEEILGSSPKLTAVLSEVARVAPTDSTVLILGETGTGKELVARAIHKQSRRANHAFIRVNCAAIPSSLISSELFGHEKGAFTGALQRRLGRFEAANAGTIFLDEIGELPAETQVALLRVLQEREFERVGSNQPIFVDVRILAATNRDLKAAVAAGTLRQDLFFRLNVFPIQMPALRDRPDDIPLLVEYFIERYAKKAGKKIRSIKKNTLELFQSYEWPGNIRELQNLVERAVLLCDGDALSIDAAWLRQETRTEAPRATVTLNGIGQVKDRRERELIEAALAECSGRISGPSGAAAKLGIPRQTLDSMIARLGINKYKHMSG
jgi:formate hydrogenlyase transcriptional activator